MKLTTTATLAAALAASAFLASTASAKADDDLGWGMAIAARVIGEKCPDTLKSDDITTLNEFITDEFQRSVAASGQGPAWWADLRDKLERSYVEKYSDPANCTEDAQDQAEEMVSDVREVMENRRGN